MMPGPLQDVDRTIAMMSRLGYPAGDDAVVSETHAPLGATEDDFGMDVSAWLDSQTPRNLSRIMVDLMTEEQRRNVHPSNGDAAVREAVAVGDETDSPFTDAEIASPVAVIAAMSPAPADATDPMPVVDALIGSVRHRTLVPTTEIIDQLLDLRGIITGAPVEVIDALIDSVRHRALVPTTEIIDQLLDLRGAVTREKVLS